MNGIIVFTDFGVMPENFTPVDKEFSVFTTHGWSVMVVSDCHIMTNFVTLPLQRTSINFATI